MRAHMILPGELIEEIDELVGPRQRSKFVAEAVREKLRRAKRIQAAYRAAGSLADVDTPGWETPEAAARWVRSLREESDRRIKESTNQ